MKNIKVGTVIYNFGSTKKHKAICYFSEDSLEITRIKHFRKIVHTFRLSIHCAERNESLSDRSKLSGLLPGGYFWTAGELPRNGMTIYGVVLRKGTIVKLHEMILIPLTLRNI